MAAASPNTHNFMSLDDLQILSSPSSIEHSTSSLVSMKESNIPRTDSGFMEPSQGVTRPVEDAESIRAVNDPRLRRSGSDEYCGLSAEITRAVSYRTLIKADARRSVSKKAKEIIVTPGRATSPSERMVMNPASRDLFMDKSSTPLMGKKAMVIQETPTTAPLTGSDDDVSSPENSPPTSIDKKKLGMIPIIPTLLDSPGSQLRQKFKIRSRRKKSSSPVPLTNDKVKKGQEKSPEENNDKKGTTVTTNDCPGSYEGTNQHSTDLIAEDYTLHQTSFPEINDYRLSSTEQDPSAFQVELPSKHEFTVHAKICALMEMAKKDSNLSTLAGLSRATLMKEYYERSSTEQPMIAGGLCHRDIVQKLLTCADDLVVEGAFREYTKKGDSTMIEACIFSSESLRQIIVGFRGESMTKSKLNKSHLFGKQVPTILGHEQKVPIIECIRSAYFGTAIEKAVFSLLTSLTTSKPFFDVVMTGHSFGAAMGTIASVRYAAVNSQMRVLCNVFGSPRIGGEEWRQLVHSIPNLRIFRAQNERDPFVMLPTGNEWVHCGHAIQICDRVLYSTGNTVTEFQAHRFSRVSPNFKHGFVQSKVILPMNLSPGSSSQCKLDHEMKSYVNKLTQSGNNWCADFRELKGQGVSGNNNELRTLA